jgi:hypothetical protein
MGMNMARTGSMRAYLNLGNTLSKDSTKNSMIQSVRIEGELVNFVSGLVDHQLFPRNSLTRIVVPFYYA